MPSDSTRPSAKQVMRGKPKIARSEAARRQCAARNRRCRAKECEAQRAERHRREAMRAKAAQRWCAAQRAQISGDSGVRYDVRSAARSGAEYALLMRAPAAHLICCFVERCCRSYPLRQTRRSQHDLTLSTAVVAHASLYIPYGTTSPSIRRVPSEEVRARVCESVRRVIKKEVIYAQEAQECAVRRSGPSAGVLRPAAEAFSSVMLPAFLSSPFVVFR